MHGDQVTSRLVFHFRDRSVDDDTTVFTQRGVFRLIRDHHIQRGPSFPKPMDVLRCTNRANHLAEQRRKNPARSPRSSARCRQWPASQSADEYPSLHPETKLSFVTRTDKPRLIHISVKPASEILFTIGDTARKAIGYVLHEELGGLTGIIAPLVGKHPRLSHLDSRRSLTGLHSGRRAAL